MKMNAGSLLTCYSSIQPLFVDAIAGVVVVATTSPVALSICSWCSEGKDEILERRSTQTTELNKYRFNFYRRSFNNAAVILALNSLLLCDYELRSPEHLHWNFCLCYISCTSSSLNFEYRSPFMRRKWPRRDKRLFSCFIFLLIQCDYW